MRALLGFALPALFAPSLALAQQVAVPAGLQTDRIEPAMRVLAREAMQLHRERRLLQPGVP